MKGNGKMDEIKLGSQVTVNEVSLHGKVVTVNQDLHSNPQYRVRRYVEGKAVYEWYYAEELTIRPASADESID